MHTDSPWNIEQYTTLHTYDGVKVKFHFCRTLCYPIKNFKTLWSKTLPNVVADDGVFHVALHYKEQQE
jgi:hypothetical protein